MGNWEWGLDDGSHIPSEGFAEGGRRPPVADFRDLDVWKEGMELAKLVCRNTSGFPREEAYGLTAQMRRACVSVPANIAEGCGRETTGAYIQFLRVAQGSLKELETLIDLSEQLGFLARDRGLVLNDRAIRTGKMLRALIGALERKSRS